MPTIDLRSHRLRQFVVACACAAAFAACEDDQAPEPLPAGIAVVDGDAQYTRKGTQLEEPVIVRVELEDGKPAAGVVVNFQVVEGGGSLSRTAATTSADGRTSVRWTVGPDTGNNRLRITVGANSNVAVTATATSSEYYCPEEDPTFAQKFTPIDDLVMLTRASSLTTASAGVIKYHLDIPNTAFDAVSIGNYPDGTFIHVVRDCVFAANGDLFVSWNHIHDEIMKVATDGELSHFATLESSVGSELAMTPNGALVGCDEFGPFYVTCRDTLDRFEGSIFTGTGRDAANNDALACDPNDGDVYFIYKQDRRLYRVPFDGITSQPREVAVVEALPIDVSDGARGMVVDGEDGSIYLLVDFATTESITKSIVRVDAAGVQTTVYDFFDRGAGDAAGMQTDLAIDRGPIRYLYTLDTINNKFLRYSIAFDQLVEFTSSGGEFWASNASEGERVGLDVIPSAGP